MTFGYFAFHLTMNIHYPTSLLKFFSHKPQPQTGFIINKNPGTISVDCYFTGKLHTEFRFKKLNP